MVTPCLFLFQYRYVRNEHQKQLFQLLIVGCHSRTACKMGIPQFNTLSCFGSLQYDHSSLCVGDSQAYA
jgi:hypothetical protein